MFFWLFFLLGLVFAQDEFDAEVEQDLETLPEVEEIQEPTEIPDEEGNPTIITPEQFRAPSLNLTKIPDTREFVTDKKFPIHIYLTNTAEQNITNVVIYDNVPDYLKVVENTNSTMVYDVIQPNETVTFTYEVIPIKSGVQIFEGCNVNFTYSFQRQHQELQSLGQIYVVQNKGFVAIAIEWAICIVIFLVVYLIYVIHRTRAEKEKQKILRAKGIKSEEQKKKEKKDKKENKKPKAE